MVLGSENLTVMDGSSEARIASDFKRLSPLGERLGEGVMQEESFDPLT